MGYILVHIIPAIGLGFIMQLILHEVGHLCGGLFSGWRFLYLQIYRLIIKREYKKLKIITVKEVGYRCIMYPKSINQDARLYTMGGCLANILFSIVGLIVLIFVSISPVIWLYIWSFIAFGIGLFFMNGIASIKRVCNDKACYNLLNADKHNKLCHNAQLITSKHLMDGLTYSEIGQEIINLCPEVAENDIQAYQAVLEYYYYLDIKNHLKMGQALNKIRDKYSISREVLEIVELELIYISIICEISLYVRSNLSYNHRRSIRIRTWIDGVKNLAININGNDFSILKRARDIHSLRIKSVYDACVLYVTESKESGIKALNEAIKLIDESAFVYPGEKRFCIRQLEEVKGIFQSGLEEKIQVKESAL